MTTQPNAARSLPRLAGNCTNGIVADSALYWSIRRELWENRSIYIARWPPPPSTCFVPDQPVLGARGMRGMMGAHGPMPPIVVLAMPYAHAAMLLMLTTSLVGTSTRSTR